MSERVSIVRTRRIDILRWFTLVTPCQDRASLILKALDSTQRHKQNPLLSHRSSSSEAEDPLMSVCTLPAVAQRSSEGRKEAPEVFREGISRRIVRDEPRVCSRPSLAGERVWTCMEAFEYILFVFCPPILVRGCMLPICEPWMLCSRALKSASLRADDHGVLMVEASYILLLHIPQSRRVLRLDSCPI